MGQSWNSLTQRLIAFSIVFVLTFTFAVSGQTIPVFKAKHLRSEGGRVAAERVELSLGSDALDVKRQNREDVRFRFADIVEAEYEFADRPSYAAGTGGVLLLGLSGIGLFFNQTKRHWLKLNMGPAQQLFELESRNYRMLLLSLNNRGVKISDLGDRDARAKEQRRKKKAEAKK